MSSRKRKFENYCESKYSVESICLRDTLEYNQFRNKNIFLNNRLKNIQATSLLYNDVPVYYFICNDR